MEVGVCRAASDPVIMSDSDYDIGDIDKGAETLLSICRIQLLIHIFYDMEQPQFLRMIA